MNSVEKLRVLGCFLETVNGDVEIYRSVNNWHDLRPKMRECGSSLNDEQYLFTHFYRLVQQCPEILDEGERRLSDLNIPPTLIREYLETYQQPSMMFGARHGDEYPHEVLDKFIERANQFALEKMKEYLFCE